MEALQAEIMALKAKCREQDRYIDVLLAGPRLRGNARNRKKGSFNTRNVVLPISGDWDRQTAALSSHVSDVTNHHRSHSGSSRLRRSLSNRSSPFHSRSPSRISFLERRKSDHNRRRSQSTSVKPRSSSAIVGNSAVRTSQVDTNEETHPVGLGSAKESKTSSTQENASFWDAIDEEDISNPENPANLSLSIDHQSDEPDFESEPL